MKAKINGVWTETYLPSALSIGNTNDAGSLYSGKTLAVMGDSISSFAGINGMQLRPDGVTEAVYYPTGNVTKAAQMWWQRVCDALGMNRGIINSYSGSRVAASHNSYTGADARAQAGCLERAKNLGASPDVIVLFMGTNDFYGTTNAVPLGSWNGKATDGANCVPRLTETNGVINGTDSTNLAIINNLNNDFRLAYAIMLDRVRTKYPYAEVWCCTLPLFEYRYGTIGGLGFPEYNTAGTSLTEWNNAIRDIATMFGCGIVYLDKCLYSAWNRDDMSVDYSEENDSGLHPNSFGHAAIANEVIRTLDPSCKVRYAVR